MKNSIVIKWLEIAKELEKSQNLAKIRCPFCDSEGYLSVKETLWPNGTKKDVHVSCPNCGENTEFRGVDV